MTDITYHLEKYKDKEELLLVLTSHKIKTKVMSTELGVSLTLRLKGEYRLIHFWVPIGAWLLSKIWPNFNLKEFNANFSSTIQKDLYVRKTALFIKNKVKYIKVSYDLLEHELRHVWQAKKYFLFHLRYGLFKKFRLRMEVDAYIYGYKDRINFDTYRYFEKEIFDHITGGEYFANIDEELVRNEISKQMAQL